MIDIYQYWTEPPPEPSRGYLKWIGRAKKGWKPNKRIRRMGCDETAEFYGMYLYEYLFLFMPAIGFTGHLEAWKDKVDAAGVIWEKKERAAGRR